jgi:hypothetical protein
MASVRMPAAELIEEVDWLLGGGMSPHEICKALSRTPGAINKAAWRTGRNDLANIFGRKELARGLS